MDKLLTKQELKEHCGIINDDFEILYDSPLPPLTTQPPAAYIEKQTVAGKAAQILWQKRGIALLVSLIPAGIAELTGDPYATVRLSDSDHVPVSTISNAQSLIQYVVTTTSPQRVIYNATPQEWDESSIVSTLRLIPLDEAKP